MIFSVVYCNVMSFGCCFLPKVGVNESFLAAQSTWSSELLLLFDSAGRVSGEPIFFDTFTSWPALQSSGKYLAVSP